MITCWSAKGGVGTTVVSTLLALELSRLHQTTVADNCGDVPTVVGMPIEGDKPGLRQWLAANASVSAEAVHRLKVQVTPELSIIPAGEAVHTGASRHGQASRLRDALPATALVVDAGVPGNLGASELVDVSDTSLVVLRPCFLALKRANECGLRADAFVLIEEAGRSLEHKDIEDVLQVPAAAVLGWDSAVARLVDAGRTKSRLPRSTRPLKALAASLASDVEAHSA